MAFALSLNLAGCGPRPGAGEMAATAGQPGRAIVVDLPALYIDYDVNGIAYAGHTRLAELGMALGRDLSILHLRQEWIARLTEANIQHVQLLNTSAGIVVLVNSEAMPSVGWDAERLVSTAHLFQALEDESSWLETVLPLVADWGMGLVVRFPLAPGAVPIPLAAPEPAGAEVVAAASAGPETAQAAYLALIGDPPQLQIEVDYAADGAWTVADMNASAWSQVVDAPWERLNLSPPLLQKLNAAGIQTITITSNRQGLFVSANDQPLPYIRWSSGEINQLVDLAQQLGLLGALNENPNAAVIVETVQRLLPFVQTLEVKLIVNFLF